MSADGNLLKGEVNCEVVTDGHEVEQLLLGLLEALIVEAQRTPSTPKIKN